LAEGENRQAFLRTLRSVVDPGGQTVSARDRLYLAAAMPTLIMWGDNDPIIPMSHGVDAHEVMPGSRLEVFEGVGHFPHVEVPEQFVEVLVDFMETTEPAHIDADARRSLLASPA
jgi:pimeloyl-ACP methyl ester carboxylesterase